MKKAKCKKKFMQKTKITVGKSYEVLRENVFCVWIVKDDGKKAGLDKRQFSIK